MNWISGRATEHEAVLGEPSVRADTHSAVKRNNGLIELDKRAATHRIALLFKSFPFFLALRFALVYFIKRVFDPYASINYSQTGEDAIIRSLIAEERTGIYVDVGCNHPIRWSNTLSLYLHGWSGINIDANPRLVEMFAKTRRRDIAVCAAVSDVEQEVLFHEFEDDLVSTLGGEVLQEWQKKWKKRGERVVTTQSLDSILNEHLTEGTEIDVLSVDVEGHDLNVLRSVDLDRYRPKLIVVEMHKFNLRNTSESAITRYLAEQDFRLIGFDTLNGYFVDQRSARSGMRMP